MSKPTIASLTAELELMKKEKADGKTKLKKDAAPAPTRQSDAFKAFSAKFHEQTQLSRSAGSLKVFWPEPRKEKREDRL